MISINSSLLFCMQIISIYARPVQSCPTLCDPMDCSPPCSSVHGILQARVLEWVAMPSLVRRRQGPKRYSTLLHSGLATSLAWCWHFPSKKGKNLLYDRGSSKPGLCDYLEGWQVGKRFKRKGTYVCLWLIHADVWQKPTQYCKAIIPQLKT